MQALEFLMDGGRDKQDRPPRRSSSGGGVGEEVPPRSGSTKSSTNPSRVKTSCFTNHNIILLTSKQTGNIARK